MAHISKSSLLLPWYDIMTRITNTHSADRKHTSWPPSLKAVKALKTRARCKHVSDEYPRRYRYKCVLSQFVLRYEACQGPLCRIVLTAPYPSHPFIVAKLEGFALQQLRRRGYFPLRRWSQRWDAPTAIRGSNHLSSRLLCIPKMMWIYSIWIDLISTNETS